MPTSEEDLVEYETDVLAGFVGVAPVTLTD